MILSWCTYWGKNKSFAILTVWEWSSLDVLIEERTSHLLYLVWEWSSLDVLIEERTSHLLYLQCGNDPLLMYLLRKERVICYTYSVGMILSWCTYWGKNESFAILTVWEWSSLDVLIKERTSHLLYLQCGNDPLLMYLLRKEQVVCYTHSVGMILSWCTYWGKNESFAILTVWEWSSLDVLIEERTSHLLYLQCGNDPLLMYLLRKERVVCYTHSVGMILSWCTYWGKNESFAILTVWEWSSLDVLIEERMSHLLYLQCGNDPLLMYLLRKEHKNCKHRPYSVSMSDTTFKLKHTNVKFTLVLV